MSEVSTLTIRGQDVALLYPLLKDATPASQVTHADLLKALALKPGQKGAKQRLYHAMARLNRYLLQTEQRYWQVVHKVGYQLLRAEQHMTVAMDKRKRAEHQIGLGLAIIQNVRQDELTPAQRQANEGMVLVMSGMYQAIQATEQRVARQEAVLDDLRRRMERLESHTPAA